MANEIAVVIPAVGSPDLTIRCLTHLALYADVPLHVIYVDNGSPPGTVDTIAGHAESLGLELLTIRNATNRGFTAAVNQGLRVARGQNVLVLNTDCFIGPGCLSRLVTHLGCGRVAAAGPVTGARGVQCIKRHVNRNHISIPDESQWDDPLASAMLVQANGGAHQSSNRLAFFCTMLSAEAIAEIGDLDERLKQLGSDDDWGPRGRKAGWELRIALGAYAAHMHKATFQRLQLDRAAIQHEAIALRNQQLLRLWRCVLIVPVMDR